MTDAATRPLSARESEIMGLLASGLSGAAIAERLVLSPETVRTHVRNAMRKLGASTRSHAVVIALENGEIGPTTPSAAGRPGLSKPVGDDRKQPLDTLLGGFVSIADIETATIYLAEDGTFLRLAAHAAGRGHRPDTPPSELTLGDPGVGRVALERRARLIPSSHTSGAEQSGPSLAAPMTAAGKLVGVLVLGIRHSRPTSRRELLLLEAFANRIAEILAAGTDSGTLSLTLKRFRSSWTETLGP